MAEQLRDATFAAMERALPTARPAVTLATNREPRSFVPDALPIPAPWVQTDPMPPLGVAFEPQNQIPAWHHAKVCIIHVNVSKDVQL